MTEQEILHTEEIKKKYSDVEREIKRNLNEALLLNNMWWGQSISRGLSITKDFKIRQLSAKENSKFLSNPSTIKSLTINNTTESVKSNLTKLIDDKVDDKQIASKYKDWINEFLQNIRYKTLKESYLKRKDCQKFRLYIKQSVNITNIKKKNIKQQLAKILVSKFWDEAFSEKPNKNNSKEKYIVLSEKSLDYLFTIFYNANKVRESRGKRIDQVFHDGDFPFITRNVKATESDYVDVITYLVDKTKPSYYGKRWPRWQKQRSKKTSQYADILWALTDNQLWIHKINFLDKNQPDYNWDETTQNLYKIWWWLLDNVITTHNDWDSANKLELTKRLKSLSSSVEKIIEWKKINDSVWLRLSSRWISGKNLGDIEQISKDRFKAFKASLKKYPEKYIPGYTPESWQTISIKEVCIDNKWVLDANQMDEIIRYLDQNVNSINSQKNNSSNEINFFKREMPESPYIDTSERESRIKKHYPEISNNLEKRQTIKGFYERIGNGAVRWKNGSYKDFKFNIIIEIKDKYWNPTWERTMELQFDDINNGKWLANYNIRNFERWINTQSRLSFSVPLCEARKMCEKCLKDMWLWAKKWTAEWVTPQEKQEFFKIDFYDNEPPINISWFWKRDAKNNKLMDKTIVKIINYFIQKWTLILCDNDEPWFSKIKKSLLTTEDLHDKESMENLHICSSLELASEQHSYLQQNRDRKVWVYLEDQNKIGRTSVWELIDPMNLWKKKDPKYSAWV